MRSKSKIWIALVILLGVATGFLVYRYLTEMEESGQEGTSMAAQVTARVKIAAGTKITQDMLQVTDVPEEFLHPDALRDPKEAVSLFAVADMVPGETVLAGKVSSEKTTGELPYKVPEGHRAITVPVNGITGVAGQVKPGHFVDVLAVYTPTDEVVDSRVHTILQRALVLAVGLDLQKEEGAQVADTVTLAVEPSEAQTIALATTIGKITLALRPAGDDSEFALEAMDLARLQRLYP